MRKIKVLLLLHDLSPTGAPKVARSAFAHLTQEIDLWTISYHGGPLGDALRSLGRVQTLVSYQWPGMPAAPRALLLFLWHRMWSVAKARLWSRQIVRWKPDVVYINSVAGLLAARRLTLPPSVPVLLHVHELDSFIDPLSQHMPELFSKLPQRYLAVSQAVFEALTVRYGIESAKVTVVSAFLDDAPGTPQERPPRLDSRCVIGGSGVISWVKGPELWLLMAAEVKKRLGSDAVRFVWVGVPDGEAGWQFHEMARKLFLTDDIEFVKFTDRPLDYFAQFDIFTVTSWEESASLVALENMRLGNPVVCFAGSGGPRELVGTAGVIVDEFSPVQMADAVCALAEDPARRDALGTAGRRRVAEHFMASVQAPRILAEIQRVAFSVPGGREDAEAETLPGV